MTPDTVNSGGDLCREPLWRLTGSVIRPGRPVCIWGNQFDWMPRIDSEIIETAREGMAPFVPVASARTVRTGFRKKGKP